jgi:PTS system mannose-specific IIA component
MIKILIVSHCGLTDELIRTAEVIAGRQDNLYSVKKDISDDNLVSLQERIAGVLNEINDREKGTLILTDMLGGTPCNAALPMCKRFNVEVLTGVNLPMIISALFAGKTALNAKELADKVLADGQKSIVNAKQLLMAKLK